MPRGAHAKTSSGIGTEGGGGLRRGVLGSAVYFWRIRREPGQGWNPVLDAAFPVAAVAICGYAIYYSVVPLPPAPVGYALWIALGVLGAGVVMIVALALTRPDRVRAFGRAFEES
jgi:hypothetical protein